jgi:hypothetical protein
MRLWKPCTINGRWFDTLVAENRGLLQNILCQPSLKMFGDMSKFEFYVMRKSILHFLLCFAWALKKSISVQLYLALTLKSYKISPKNDVNVTFH